MTCRSPLSLAALAALLLLPMPERLAACAFHTVLPEATLSRQIAGAIGVIAARPSASDPFRFEAVAVLKGAAPKDHPSHLVDSATRRRLAGNPHDAVLFAREADGSWTRLLVLDAATRPIVDLMLARAGDWATPADAAALRDIFAPLLGHPDDGVRRLALRELDALPYAVLRGGAYTVPADDLLRGIADIQDMPLAPIRILLLGLGGGDSGRAMIERQLRQMADTGAGTNFGAWAMALIESTGAEGILDLEHLFLTTPGQLSRAQLAELVRALSVQSAEGDPALRSAIDGATRRLVVLDPDAAPLIAQAFGTAADYSQVGLFHDLLAARALKDRPGLIAVAAYVTGARMAAGALPSSAPRDPDWRRRNPDPQRKSP
jgi:hypothetical protein